MVETFNTENTMRTAKELLEIVLDEFENERLTDGYIGICMCIRYLEDSHLITLEEMRFLLEFIKQNRPKEGKHFSKFYESNDYFWAEYSKPPRIAWLKHLIGQCEGAKNKIRETFLKEKDDGLYGFTLTTACCGKGPITDENYCPNCGRKIKKNKGYV